MRKVRLGKTELMVTKTSFGCLPIQRRDMDTAVKILRRAYEAGINYYDSATAYTDSEQKIGEAFSDVRENVIISTKTMARDYDTTMRHIEQSLRMLKTDYIDIMQIHNIQEVPSPDDKSSAFYAMLEMQKAGHVRHIGASAHKIGVAFDAVKSGLFETMQYPFSHISAECDFDLVKLCAEKDVGFIAMKGLAGGLITNARVCYAFMKDYPVAPIWGVQTMEELEQWIALDEENPSLDDEMREVIERDRAELVGTFCRSCGYCMPCPVGIDIAQSARMKRLLRRTPHKPYMSDEWYEKMHRINDCIDCGSCRSKCPYGLDTPALLRYMLRDYDEFYAEHKDD